MATHGDLSGDFNAPTVSGIKGVPVTGTPTTGQVLTYNGTSYAPAAPSGGGSTGTVTTASIVSANGFAGTVANPTTTPAITLTTTATGILKGNGTAVGAATDGTDYLSSNVTATVTNKRITRRVVTVTQSATPTINTDITDIVSITGLAQAITGFTVTGTPVAGDSLIVELTDDGTGRAITWGSSFESSTVALPGSTTAGVKLITGFFRNTVTSKWRCVAVA